MTTVQCEFVVLFEVEASLALTVRVLTGCEVGEERLRLRDLGEIGYLRTDRLEDAIIIFAASCVLSLP